MLILTNYSLNKTLKLRTGKQVIDPQRKVHIMRENDVEIVPIKLHKNNYDKYPKQGKMIEMILNLGLGFFSEEETLVRWC